MTSSITLTHSLHEKQVSIESKSICALTWVTFSIVDIKLFASTGRDWDSISTQISRCTIWGSLWPSNFEIMA